MKLFKLTVICGSVLSLAGCFSTPTTPDAAYKPAMSAAYVDLLIEKAKAEERARVMAELAEQNKDDKRFSEIKINQLESKIEQLSPSEEYSDQGIAKTVQQDNAIESVPDTTLDTSSDPLLEQWKNIYAQEEANAENGEIVTATEIIKEADINSEESRKESDVYDSEPVVQTENSPVMSESVMESSPVYESSPSVTVASSDSFDTVIRQCVAGQKIPNPYLGSLPEVLNSGAQPGDTIKLPTLCKWSRSPDIIKQLQIALSEQGFLKPSPPHDLEVIDGIWGVNTLNSLINYQKSRGLAYGQLSIESLVDLGVINYSDVVNRKGSKRLLKSEVPPDIGMVEKVKQEVKPTPEPQIKPEPEVIPEPNIKPEPEEVFVSEEKPVATPEVTSPQVEAQTEVKTEADIASAPKSVKFEKAETKHCYVNQVIPGDYRGKIAELVENSKESKVGYVQELPTLCKKDRSTEIITKLQRALYGLGYLKGGAAAINGVWNKNTLNAVRAYQKEKGLAYGQLSIEVLETLGVL